MVTSPDGMGIIIVGGMNEEDYNIYAKENRLLESRFDGFKFLPWKFMTQNLKYSRNDPAVIPIPKSITN